MSGRLLVADILFPQIFTLLCALMRLFTRIFIVKAAGWDDFFVVLVMVSFTNHDVGRSTR